MQSKRAWIILFIGIFTLILCSLLNLIWGQSSLNWSEIWLNKESSQAYIIFNEIRLPKAITALIAGAALSVSGLQMQTLFKNPLAGPHILGISSGSGLGVALLVMASGISPIFLNLSTNPWGIILASCIGSLLFMFIIFSMALRIQHVMTLLLLGIMLSSAVSAMIALIQYYSDADSLKTYVIWTMGSLSNTHWEHLKIMALICIIGFIISISTPKSLNQLLLGENYAKSLGQNIKKSRLLILSSTGLLTGAVTAFCGPISFIGLAVPHLVRLIIMKQNHLWLLPLSAIYGGSFLLLCDWLCHWNMWSSILPINALTSLAGSPFIIYLLLKNKNWLK